MYSIIIENTNYTPRDTFHVVEIEVFTNYSRTGQNFMLQDGNVMTAGTPETGRDIALITNSHDGTEDPLLGSAPDSEVFRFASPAAENNWIKIDFAQPIPYTNDTELQVTFFNQTVTIATHNLGTTVHLLDDSGEILRSYSYQEGGTVSGTAYQSRFWKFQFDFDTQDDSPVITSTSPEDNATDILFDTSFALTFDKEILLADDAGIVLKGGASDIDLAPHFDLRSRINSNTFTIANPELLDSETLYTLSVSEGSFESRYGVKSEPFSFSFRTRGVTDIADVVTRSDDSFYENSLDDGTFPGADSIRVTLPEGIHISSSLSDADVFGVDFNDMASTPTVPLTIDGLPDGVKVKLTKNTAMGRVTSIDISLTGAAVEHLGRDNNTNFSLTFGSEMWEVDTSRYIANDIDYDFQHFFSRYQMVSSREPRNGGF